MINAKISDFTSSLYVNFTRDLGESIIGLPAEIFRQKEQMGNTGETKEFFDSLMFKYYKVVVKARMESYMGEQRIRYCAIKVESRDGANGLRNLKSENMQLLERLKLYQDMPEKAKNMGNGAGHDQDMDDSFKPFQ